MYNIILLNEVDSTNNYANHLIMSEAAEEGTVVLTRYQKMGRGYATNAWESAAGKNLLASIIFYPHFLPAKDQFMLSKVVSLGLYDFASKETADVKIKWPNDLLVDNKKLAGILIENSVKGPNLESVVAGIGINLNQTVFLSDAPNPVSLKQFTGKEYDVQEVCKTVTERVFSWYEELRKGNYSKIDLAYINQLYRHEEWTLFKKGDDRFEARILGIGEFGQLITEDRSNRIRTFMFKEVEMIL